MNLIFLIKQKIKNQPRCIIQNKIIALLHLCLLSLFIPWICQLQRREMQRVWFSQPPFQALETLVHPLSHQSSSQNSKNHLTVQVTIAFCLWDHVLFNLSELSDFCLFIRRVLKQHVMSYKGKKSFETVSLWNQRKQSILFTVLTYFFCNRVTLAAWFHVT